MLARPGRSPGINSPILLASRSVNQKLPSRPLVIEYSPVRVSPSEYSTTLASPGRLPGISSPIRLVPASVNQRVPPGPADEKNSFGPLRRSWSGRPRPSAGIMAGSRRQLLPRGIVMSEDLSFPELVRRVRAGDEDAAAELVRRYEPAIRRSIRLRLAP